MKKTITLLLALAAMLCVLPMNGDTPPDRPVEIPIRKPGSHGSVRSLCEIQAYYYGMFSAVHTSATLGLGEINVNVTNCSTGEFWEDCFDSSMIPQHYLTISSTPGLYEVTYTTSSGDLFVGTFEID